MQSNPSEVKSAKITPPSSSNWCFRVEKSDLVRLPFPDGTLSSPFYNKIKLTLVKKRKLSLDHESASGLEKKTTPAPEKKQTRGFSCDYDGCEFQGNCATALARHKCKHTGEKPLACNFVGCAYRCNQSGALITHKRTHTGEKPYICGLKGCEYRCTTSGNLKKHRLRHTGEKSHLCDFDGCAHRSYDLAALNRHRRMHTGEKPYFCDAEGCKFRCSLAGGLKNHKLTHSGEKLSVCDFKGCAFRCSRPGNLKIHQRVHTDEKPYVCASEGCDFRCNQPSNLKSHCKRKHTPEGVAKQKKKENRMYRALDNRGIVVDRREHRVDFSCIGSTFARLDFVIRKEDRIVIIECQENAHDHIPVQCDPIRAAKVAEALAVSGNTLPVEFHFVNPDRYTVDGETKKVKYDDRMDAVAESARTPAIKDIKPLSLVYWFYPVERGLPRVVWEKDYPKELRDCVRCHY